MLSAYRTAFTVLLILSGFFASGQNIQGKVIDAVTKEPVQGASITRIHARGGSFTDHTGAFIIQSDSATVIISYIGYRSAQIKLHASAENIISLVPETSVMQEVVLTANRDAVKRSDAPVAISSISTKMLNETRATSVDQVLNKVSGVYMVNLGNEQHSMSIRQPMTTKSLFLYLEDGIPVRTTGLYNHNAILEMNMAAVKSIEVIRGPSSSLYGSEAIGGVVNFITHAPGVQPVLKMTWQNNDIGYKRADLQTSFTTGKWGFALSGYYARKDNSFIEYSDFHKTTLTARADYRASDRTTISTSATWLDYYSDMAGGIDSLKFASRSFTNPHTFTYREVNAFRAKSIITQEWNAHSKTTASVIYRRNSIGQNPAYSVRDDYRRLSNGTFTGKKDLAHGEINESSFNSYAAVVQHKQNLNWQKATLLVGSSIDLSPSDYTAEYIRINKDTTQNKYSSYEKKDSILTNYSTGINNYAAFVNFEFNPLNKLRVVASLRYDLFKYNFNNRLKSSSFSGTPDTKNNFSALSPKLGFTYQLSNKAGVYANYSQGFVPPQVTELYRGVKVPELKPSTFYNYEIGGWAAIIKNKLTADASIYKLDGTNEIVSVRLDDGTTINMNAGETSHQGIEFGLTALPVPSIHLRVSGAYSQHKFISFNEKGNNYSGKTMNGAPQWMHNAEVWYKPEWLKGARIGIEWQKIGSYFQDPANTAKYKGHNVIHARAGYKFDAFDIWVNVMNITNEYYAYTSSKSNSGYSYTPAEPRHFNAGIAYDFGKLFKSK